MEKQTISRMLPNGFKLITLVGAIFAAIVAQLEATNIPPESALTIDGGHVVVNDDDTNKNEIWDKTEEFEIENKGLEGPKTTAKPEPVLRQFSFTAKWADTPGVLTITPSIPPAHIKLWKDEKKKEPFTFEYSYAVTSYPGKTVTFWVEGIEPTESFDSIKFTAVYTVTNPTSGLSATATGTIAFGVTQADLDIDSDNQNGTEATGYDETEDQIEFSFKEQHPGKILLETRNDVDSDGVIDSVDGISELPSTGGTPTVAGLKLIPMRLTLNKPFTTANAKVKFSYRASVPRLGEGIEANGQDTAGNTLYRITSPGMRLWIKDGDERTSGKDVGGTDSGDFIPADTEIKWEDLFKPDSEESTEKIIYVEYVDVEGSDKQFSKEDIVVEISDDTSAAKGYIQYNGGEKKPLLGTKSPDGVNAALLPVEVAVDANRDGKIEFDGSDRTTVTDPYVFWINEDHDLEHTVDTWDKEEDDLNDGVNDAWEPNLHSRRDMEDLTRIWIDIKSILDLVGGNLEGVTLSTSMDLINGDPGINLFKAVEASGGRQYIKDPDTGWNQYHDGYEIEVARLWTSNSSPDTWKILPHEELVKASSRNGKVYLLLEGAEIGKGKILFKVTKGELELELPPVYIDLKKVTDMYETWTVGDVADAGVEWENTFPASSATKVTGAGLLAPETPEEKDYILFIHGWNMPGWEKEAYASTMFKRMWHQGYKGRFGAFRWPTFYGYPWSTSLTAAHFDGSEQRAWNSAAPLKNLVANLASTFKDDSGKSLVRLYAHSMGNVVASEALRQMTPANHVHTYISAQAALSAHVWDNTTKKMEFGHTTPDIYGYYWQSGATFSDDLDKWEKENRPSYMAPQYMPTTTRFINHYNANDWALASDKWQFNQKLKPNKDYQYERLGLSSVYEFTHNTSSFNEDVIYLPNDRFEIFSYAAESRSFATGTEALTKGKFNVADSVNLDGAPYNFGEEHKGHSAQFRSCIQERWSYWQKLLDDMKVILP